MTQPGRVLHRNPQTQQYQPRDGRGQWEPDSRTPPGGDVRGDSGAVVTVAHPRLREPEPVVHTPQPTKVVR